MEKAVFYFRVTDIWKELCEQHSLLFDATCEEYALLLESDIEKLDEQVSRKENIIGEISKLEKLRAIVIKDLNEQFKANIQSVSDLTNYFSDFETEKNQRHLFRFNALLIDIIEKIQEQNKKNQMFITKAIRGLREIRENAAGVKSLNLYEKTGREKVRTLSV